MVLGNYWKNLISLGPKLEMVQRFNSVLEIEYEKKGKDKMLICNS